MKLRKLNGRYQPVLSSGEDLASLIDLDPVHWSANCAPTEGLSCSPDFLRFLDSDNNAKIMPFEIQEACRWIQRALNSLSGFVDGSDRIALSDFRADTSVGVALRNTAEQVLKNLSHADCDSITLSDVRSRTEIQQAAAMNGDGVIPPSAIEDPQQRQLCADILLVFGGVKDLNGEMGIGADVVSTFVEKANAWQKWASTRPQNGIEDSTLAAVAKLKEEIDRFFTACQFEKPDVPDRTLLARPQREGSISAQDWVLPVYRDDWGQFVAHVLVPRGQTTLTWRLWEEIHAATEAYRIWRERAPVGWFERLSTERIQAMVEDVALLKALENRIAADKASAEVLSKLADLEKTLLLQRDLRAFLNSYVNFSDFYNPKKRSVPEVGALLMDGRWFRLSVRVFDRVKHKERAKDGGFFLLYVQIRISDTETMEVATAVTGKERGDLHVGKRGVFFFHDGMECSAEVVDILNNPINIWEAFIGPFLSVRTFLTKRIERFSEHHTKQLEAVAEGSVAASPGEKNALLNSGVTIAALSSSFAYLIKTISSIQITQLLGLVIAPLMVVAIVSSILAWWNVRRRDLGAVLEASGWGINHPLYAPNWAARVFTQSAVVTREMKGKEKDMLIAYQESVDPFGRSLSYLILLLVGLVAAMLLFYLDYIVALYEWSSFSPE
ncbi:MAG: hypothetical protein VX278_19970 [Myxococcota bacterium]|nr:hypothetical protein [Myxococcota bacterium]